MTDCTTTDPVLVGGRQHLTCRFRVDEVQEITSNATGGTMTITTGTGATATVPWNATTMDVEAKLPGTHCTGGPLPGNPLRIRWIGRNGGDPIPPATINTTNLTGGEASIATVQDGGPIVLDEPPTVTVTDPFGASTETVATDDGGGGDYTIDFTPEVAGTHYWWAKGTHPVHGPVAVPRQEFYAVR